MTERLVAHGLLQREPSPASRREILISLTAAGRRVVRHVSEAQRASVTKIVTAMPRPERTGLLQALHTFTTGSGQLAHVEHAALGPSGRDRPARPDPESGRRRRSDEAPWAVGAAR
ncbi:hypothetical protein GCM10010524_17900 [Streptomyces mexicanus]|jgi:hypothetical protein